MLAFERSGQSDLTTTPCTIRVIGVGGAGVNMLDRLKINHVENLDLTVVNTDQRALQASVVEDKVQLGRELTRGLGAGGDPEVGRSAVLASMDAVGERLAKRDVVFLCGGLGGGTATGAMAEVARAAREGGALVVAFVTMPFSFEGRRRVAQAMKGLDGLQEHCHALMTFQNNRMSELIDAEDGIHAAFSKVDLMIASAIRSISNIVSNPGLIRLGLDDLMSALEDNHSDCLFGFAESSSEQRVQDVVEQVMKSPLLSEEKLARQARNVLVHVAGGSSLSLHEVEEVMEQLSKEIHSEALILFGTSVEAGREGLALTVISSLADEPYPETDPDGTDDSAGDHGGFDGDGQGKEQWGVEAERDGDALGDDVDESVAEQGKWENESFIGEQEDEQQQADEEWDAADDGLEQREMAVEDEGEDGFDENELADFDGENEQADERLLAQQRERIAEAEQARADQQLREQQELEEEQRFEQEQREEQQRLELEQREDRERQEREEQQRQERLEREQRERELRDRARVEAEKKRTEQEREQQSADEQQQAKPQRSKPREGLRAILGSRQKKKEAATSDSSSDPDPAPRVSVNKRSSDRAQGANGIEDGEKKSRAKPAQSAEDLFASLEGKGRFKNSDPTIEDGENLDLPTFLRKRQ